MNKYTIYCTEEQTRKALELGAPLIETPNDGFLHTPSTFIRTDLWYNNPTTEQMIGWLEEQHPIDHIDIYKQVITWRFCVYTSTLDRCAGKGNSRKEATLAAIDAALEYLINK